MGSQSHNLTLKPAAMALRKCSPLVEEYSQDLLDRGFRSHVYLEEGSFR
jgi:hypothetical protein